MTPIFVRALDDAERELLPAGLRSCDAFVLRRCQIVLASAKGQRASAIAATVGCDDQTVRNVIRDFNARGLDTLVRRSSRPHMTQAAFSAPRAEQLRDLLHQSPRTFGKPTSLWTLDLAAEVSFEQGLTAEQVSGETIRATLGRRGMKWQRAKHWITSPDPAYTRKKHARDRLIRLLTGHPDWVLGYEDETWWSRLAQPDLHAWTEADLPLRLVEQTLAKDDPEGKALACYGLLLRWQPRPEQEQERLWLRFVEGRPVSDVTIQFLDWSCRKLSRMGKPVLMLVWDNASWHISYAVRDWIREHNRQVKRSGHSVRILVCLLPSKSPWLNPIEPKWIHGKRRVVEPNRVLPSHELAERVCETFGCVHEPHLLDSKKVV